MKMRNVNDIAFAIVTETNRAVAISKALVRDAEIAATAKVRALDFTNCRNCQAGIENFLIEYPDCSDAAVQSYLEDVVPPARPNITLSSMHSIKNNPKF